MDRGYLQCWKMVIKSWLTILVINRLASFCCFPACCYSKNCIPNWNTQLIITTTVAYNCILIEKIRTVENLREVATSFVSDYGNLSSIVCLIGASDQFSIILFNQNTTSYVWPLFYYFDRRQQHFDTWDMFCERWERHSKVVEPQTGRWVRITNVQRRSRHWNM